MFVESPWSNTICSCFYHHPRSIFAENPWKSQPRPGLPGTQKTSKNQGAHAAISSSCRWWWPKWAPWIRSPGRDPWWTALPSPGLGQLMGWRRWWGVGIVGALVGFCGVLGDFHVDRMGISMNLEAVDVDFIGIFCGTLKTTNCIPKTRFPCGFTHQYWWGICLGYIGISTKIAVFTGENFIANDDSLKEVPPFLYKENWSESMWSDPFQQNRSEPFQQLDNPLRNPIVCGWLQLDFDMLFWVHKAAQYVPSICAVGSMKIPVPSPSTSPKLPINQSYVNMQYDAYRSRLNKASWAVKNTVTISHLIVLVG